MNLQRSFQNICVILILSNFIFLIPLGWTSTTSREFEPKNSLSQPLDVEERHFQSKFATFMLQQQYTPHESIYIRKNADIVTYEFPGAGTEENPYVIEGFNLTQIYIYNTTAYFYIRNNLITNCITSGIFMSSNGIIDSNIITNCTGGIYIDSDDNNVTRNTVSYCGGDGIIVSAKDCTVTNNTIYYCAGKGIIAAGDNCIVTHNSISNCEAGIIVVPAKNCIVVHNNISDCEKEGIYLDLSERTTVIHNTVAHCLEGITLRGAKNNLVICNTISHNRDYGISLDFGVPWGPEEPLPVPRYNTMMENDFLNNTLWGSSQAFDNGMNNVFAENYWDNHENTDQNGDGHADTPYPIEGATNNEDLSPLMVRVSPPHLYLPIITDPNGGETFQDTITIQWVPALDVRGHPVTYEVLYSKDNGLTWISLVVGLTNPGYEWNITKLAEGSYYRIKVVATCVDGISAEYYLHTPFSIRYVAHNLLEPTVLFPNGGEILQGRVFIQWAPASDTWEHPVFYTVSYSAGDGYWITLAGRLTHPSCEWDTTLVADGSSYQIRVVATCEANWPYELLTAEDRSDTSFTIQNQVSTTTSSSSVEAFSIPGGPVIILLVTLLLILLPIIHVKQRSLD